MEQLFYLLVPLGVAMLIFSIRGLIGAVKVKLLYKQPYAEENGSFTVTEAGNYGIWLNGKQFGKSPYGEFGLQLSLKEMGESIPLSRVLLRTTRERSRNHTDGVLYLSCGCGQLYFTADR